MLRVSVVVPTRERPHLLRRCLQALLNQDYIPRAYEVIVVDDAPNEATHQVVHSMQGDGEGERPCIRYLPNHGLRHSPAVARNLGWRASQAEIIAFTDDDCIPAPNWLSAALAHFAPDILGVTGRVVVPLPDDPTDYERDVAGLQGIQFLTANCFYRREALTAVGGFDEQFTQAWREDSDLFFALLRHYDGDDRFVSAPEAVITHPVRPAPWGISIEQQRRSIFNALLYKKHPHLYRALIQDGPPWHYYQTVVALLLALLSGLVGVFWLAGASVLVWLWLTGRFCLRRLQQASHAPAHIAEMVVTSIIIPPLAVFWRLAGAVKYRVLFM